MQLTEFKFGSTDDIVMQAFFEKALECVHILRRTPDFPIGRPSFRAFLTDDWVISPRYRCACACAYSVMSWLVRVCVLGLVFCPSGRSQSESSRNK